MTKYQQDIDTFGSNNEGKYVLVSIVMHVLAFLAGVVTSCGILWLLNWLIKCLV